MKRSLIFNLVLSGLVLAVGTTGCKHRPTVVTLLHDKKALPPVEPPNPEPPLDPNGSGKKFPPEDLNVKPGKPPGDDLSNIDLINGMIPDAAKFKANTVYFEFDRHVVRPTEKVKIEEVALYLKGASDHKLLIDGHCDERGTEEYNRALGERRALALREYLTKLGIAGDRVYTRTYGEDRAAVEGHDEAAWSKNRRGEFILCHPKGML